MLLEVEDVDLDVYWSDVLDGKLKTNIIFDLELFGVRGEDSDLTLFSESLELLLGEVIEGGLDWFSFEESGFNLESSDVFGFEVFGKSGYNCFGISSILQYKFNILLNWILDIGLINFQSISYHGLSIIPSLFFESLSCTYCKFLRNIP